MAASSAATTSAPTEKYHSTTGKCAGNPYLTPAPTRIGSNGNNYLVLKYIRVSASGSNQESECALGADGCDGGLRRTRLTG